VPENSDMPMGIETHIGEGMLISKPVIITFSGKARHGKDTALEIAKQHLEGQGKKVACAGYADYLKEIATSNYGWDGEKGEKGRTLLQSVGSDYRAKDYDFWVNHLINQAESSYSGYDYILIRDARYLNEIFRWEEEGYYSYNIHVERPNFHNGLTSEQQSHTSEISLDDYTFDIYVKAEDLESLDLVTKQGVSDIAIMHEFEQERDRYLAHIKGNSIKLEENIMLPCKDIPGYVLVYDGAECNSINPHKNLSKGFDIHYLVNKDRVDTQNWLYDNKNNDTIIVPQDMAARFISGYNQFLTMVDASSPRHWKDGSLQQLLMAKSMTYREFCINVFRGTDLEPTVTRNVWKAHDDNLAALQKHVGAVLEKSTDNTMGSLGADESQIIRK